MRNSDAAHGCFYLFVLGLICSCFAGCGIGWLAGGLSYSDGYREGYVQKFSTKGIIWSTHEGELALPGLRPVGLGEDQRLTNVWEFSVNDAELVKQIKELHQNELIRLHYKQYLCSPPWKGSTSYFITKIERIKKQE